jgi:outer membrane protein OmpA-like peptidoglycan-associated protein
MSHAPAPPSRNRTGAVAATPDRRRRPAWLIPLLGLLGLLALALLALALYALLHHSGKKSVTAPVAEASPTGASTASGLPASPSSGTASGEAAPGAGSGSAPASAGSGAAGGSGTGSAAGGAALVGGGGVAATAATGVEAGTAGGSSAAKGAGSAAAGTAQGTVLFASDSAALDANARQVLAAAVARIKAQHPSKVTVTGYTDVVGGQPTNSNLSLQRAEAVASVLGAELGSTPPVTAAAKGAADPVASNSTEGGRQQNRRASITNS